MSSYLKNFRIGWPQVFAALLLSGLLAQALALAWRTPMTGEEYSSIRQGAELALHRSVWRGTAIQEPAYVIADSILVARVTGMLFPRWGAFDVASVADSGGHTPHTFLFCMRLPFVVFGLWLGGALWWVTRRLFNNEGGYVALALYCFSPHITAMSSTVNAEIVAAWGLFGIVYTAIGVAHTLYAPPRKWGPRIVLLGTAFGITAAAHLTAALVGFVLAAVFLLYLAPGRRLASAGILAVSGALGMLILRAFYGFATTMVWQLDWRGAARLQLSQWNAARQFLISENLPVFVLLLLALATFALWRKTRYFGNWTPLLVVVLLLALTAAHGNPMLWGLTFIFVFIGGMVADLLDSKRRLPAFLVTGPLLCAQIVVALLRTFAVR
jgi:hypothetical protein